MARFHGQIGYSIPYEAEPGIFKDQMVEKPYFGTVTQHTRRWEKGEGLNDDLTLENRLSILADDYAYQHCSGIKYVRWMNACWKVTSMKVERPRILLSLGGVWNGKTA